MKARLEATKKAEELESQLDPDIPSFVKAMLHSHVVRGFWLLSTQLYTRLLSLATYAMCWFFCMYDRKGLPSHFCDTYMPKQDAIITLLDEKDEKFDTNYLAYKKGLSGGWAGFALCHGIQDGDAAVFQLIKPTTFKVLYALSAILFFSSSKHVFFFIYNAQCSFTNEFVSQVYIIRAASDDGSERDE